MKKIIAGVTFVLSFLFIMTTYWSEPMKTDKQVFIENWPEIVTASFACVFSLIVLFGRGRENKT